MTTRGAVVRRVHFAIRGGEVAAFGKNSRLIGAVSHTFAVPSPFAVTIRDPSELNDAEEKTTALCPLSVRRSE